MRWLVFMIAVSAMMAPGTATAEYVQSGPTSGTIKDDPADTETSTKVEYTDVDADARNWGYCYCRVYARSWAKAVDSALTRGFGEGYWQTSWQWQGPPSTPPGGSLYWYIYVEGSAEAWGSTDPGNGGSAISDANGYSYAFYPRSTGPTYDGGGAAYGSVEDSNVAIGDATLEGYATQLPEAWWAYRTNGYYDCYVGWKLTWVDEDSVASGTSSIYILGGVACDGTTYASAGGAGSGSEAEAELIMQATATTIEAELTSN